MAPKKAASAKGSAKGNASQAASAKGSASQAKASGTAPHSVESFAGAPSYSDPNIRPRNVEEPMQDSHAEPVAAAEHPVRQQQPRSAEPMMHMSFEPQRHVSLVCGRPVQVLGDGGGDYSRIAAIHYCLACFCVTRNEMSLSPFRESVV